MDAISRRLLFRIGTVGFCVSLEDLVEIREQLAEVIDYQQKEVSPSLVGTLLFRQKLIPVVDLAPRLELASLPPGTALILNSVEENWALLVDCVDGFCAVSEMADFQLPHLLRREGWRCFDQVSLRNGVPYFCLDPMACYPRGRV